MSVPGHDERDFEFAQKFGLPIRKVIVQSAGLSLSTATEEQAKACDSNRCFYRIWSLGEFRRVVRQDVARMQSVRWPHLPRSMVLARLRRLIVCGIGAFRGSDFGVRRSRSFIATKCGTVPEKYENLPVRTAGNGTVHRHRRIAFGKGSRVLRDQMSEVRRVRHDARRTRWTRLSIRRWYYFRYTDPHNAKCLSIREMATLLDACRSVHRRRRSRGDAPDLCTILDKGDARYGHGEI